ncbi:MAG TPA: hypothetical protein VJ302_19620 [Blastocatellia bacterium]|nr:hypothetical protein [Blastocatellia bacterium]
MDVGSARPSRRVYLRWALKLALILLVVYSFLVAGFYAAMCQRPGVFSQIMSKTPGLVFLVFPFKTMWLSARSGTLKVGDAAPDFSLRTHDGNSSVQLSALKGQKPVVLVFGSYT